MHEDILALLTRDEAEALLGIEELYGTCCQLLLFSLSSTPVWLSQREECRPSPQRMSYGMCRIIPDPLRGHKNCYQTGCESFLVTQRTSAQSGSKSYRPVSSYSAVKTIQAKKPRTKIPMTRTIGQPPKASFCFILMSYSRFSGDPTLGNLCCFGLRGFPPELPIRRVYFLSLVLPATPEADYVVYSPTRTYRIRAQPPFE